MAYNTAYPPRLLASVDDGATPSVWTYYTTDSLAAVQASGYFTNAVNVGLRVKDIVIVIGPGKTPTQLMVESISSGAASVRPNAAFTPGAGISGGTGTVFYSWQTQDGPVIKSNILIDITGLNAGGTAGDIIGTDGAGAAYLGQVTAAKHGTIFKGQMTCLETPAGPTGGDDIDVYAASVGTGVEDVAISGLSGQAQLVNAGASAKGSTDAFTAFPAADSYLYLVGQGTGNATFTAGILLIELWGHGTIA